jgi:PBSX family phage terminase large subunit
VTAPRVIGGFAPNERQLEAARAAIDPEARVVLLDGAIRSGKSQAAARILLEWAVAQPATYLVARATYRSLRDSTMKAMLFGDGGLPPLIPAELLDEYRASDELVRLKTGSEILFRSLEEGQVSKILNLSLGGVLVDQVEELDGGDAGERVYDTLLGRLSDPRGPRKMLLVANPAGLTSWQYRRLVDEASRDPGVARVHFTLRDNAANLPADYVAAMEATAVSRPAWFRSFILGEWGAFEGAAYEEFQEAVHVVDPFPVHPVWARFESMDHGAANPTAWHSWAVDEDGNLIVVGEHYKAGWLVSQHAARVKALRASWYGPGERMVSVYADPSVAARSGVSGRSGGAASVRSEYAEHGIELQSAANDRAAGYLRLLELLHVDEARLFPAWHPRYGEAGSPRLFVSRAAPMLVEQLRSAPVARDGQHAGEIVDPTWESSRGHAHASARYGVLSARLSAPSRAFLGQGESLVDSWFALRDRVEGGHQVRVQPNGMLALPPRRRVDRPPRRSL